MASKPDYAPPMSPPPNYAAPRPTQYQDAGPFYPQPTPSPGPNAFNQLAPYNNNTELRAPDPAYGGYYGNSHQQGYYGPPPQGYYAAGPQGYYGGPPPMQQGMYYQHPGPMYGPPTQGYYYDDRQGGSGAAGICGGILGALACCCCLDMLLF